MTKSIDVIPTWYWPDGVPRYLTPPRTSVYKAAVQRWARRTPERIALRWRGLEMSYRELDERVRLASSRLRRAPGDEDSDERRRIAVDADDGFATVVALLGALHAGADVLMVDPATPDDDQRRLLEDHGCELLVAARPRDGEAAWEQISAEIVARAAMTADRRAEESSIDRSVEARLGFTWGDAVVLQPGGPLLGWALAFRAFAGLETGELFTVVRPLSCWEGVIGLLAPLAVGSTSLLPDGSLGEVLESSNGDARGLWLEWKEAEAVMGSKAGGRKPHRTWRWIYASVEAPPVVRRRRQLGRFLGGRILTVFGTPATGPVAASPRSWFIEEAVGTPMTGVDLIPVDPASGLMAEPPWPVLAYASVGVRSTFQASEMVLRGAAPGRLVPPDLVDVGRWGRIDANGFLYLI